jgi:capsid protein
MTHHTTAHFTTQVSQNIAGSVSGALELPGFAENPARYLAVKWIPPKWDWVDPLKDRKAEIEAIEAGLKSRSDVIESEGYDAEEVDRRIGADHAREEELGLKFGKSAAAQATPIDEIDPEDRERANQSEENAA